LLDSFFVKLSLFFYYFSGMKKIIIIPLLILLVFTCNAHKLIIQKDSLKKNSESLVIKKRLTIKSQIIPLSLMAASGIIYATNIRNGIQDKLGNLTHTKIDDYIQYIPDVTVYFAHFLGCEHKNSLWNTTKYLAMSQILTAVFVQSVKRITNISRPYGGKYTFPSGHTSQAFVGATAQYHEFKDYDKIFAYCGYVFASAVGIMRVTNNNHWSTDVLFGAGLGMLITNLVYYFEPFKEWNPFKKKKFAITPSLNYYGSTAILGVNITL